MKRPAITLSGLLADTSLRILFILLVLTVLHKVLPTQPTDSEARTEEATALRGEEYVTRGLASTK